MALKSSSFGRWAALAAAAVALAGLVLLVRLPTGPAPAHPPARDADGFYRDPARRLRIRFPAGWALAPGGGNVLVKSLDPTVPANMYVMVTPEPRGAGSVDAATLLSSTRDKVEASLKAGGGKLLEAKVVPFAGAQAAYLRIDAPYARPVETKRAVNEQWLLVKDGVIYSVSATMRAEDYPRLEPDVEAAASTFTFD